MYSEQVALLNHTYVYLLAYRSLSHAWNHPSTYCTRVITLQRTISISWQGDSISHSALARRPHVSLHPCPPAEAGAQQQIRRHQRRVGARQLCLAKNALQIVLRALRAPWKGTACWCVQPAGLTKGFQKSKHLKPSELEPMFFSIIPVAIQYISAVRFLLLIKLFLLLMTLLRQRFERGPIRQQS